MIAATQAYRNKLINDKKIMNAKIASIVFFLDNTDSLTEILTEVFGYKIKFSETNTPRNSINGKHRFVILEKNLSEIHIAHTSLLNDLQKLETKVNFINSTELAFSVENVQLFHDALLKYECTELSAPHTAPWGQFISYLKHKSGLIICLVKE